MAAPLLDLRKVTKSFGGLTVIDDLDLDVKEGEIVSVIGPNGASPHDTPLAMEWTKRKLVSSASTSPT